jgi:hypothetical protein
MTSIAWVMLSNEFDVDKLVDAALDIDAMEIHLILNG